MKYRPSRIYMPWDIFVFLTITSVGFGFSIRSLLHPEVAQVQTGSLRIVTAESAGENLSMTAAAVADLGCLEGSVLKRFTGIDGGVRIKGRLCSSSRKGWKNPEGIKVKNVTNGFEGTVFFREKDSSFTTDYLVLRAGRNAIQVEWEEPRTGKMQVAITEVFQK